MLLSRKILLLRPQCSSLLLQRPPLRRLPASRMQNPGALQSLLSPLLSPPRPAMLPLQWRQQGSKAQPPWKQVRSQKPPFNSVPVRLPPFAPVANTRAVWADAAPEEAREGSGAQAGPSHARGLDGGAQPSGREVLTVEEAQHLVEEGEHLPVDQEVLAALRHNLQLVQSWEARLSNIGHSQVGTFLEGVEGFRF